jgi:disulfide oxidoreductase YuzD
MPLPIVKYEVNRKGDLFFITDRLDSICAPAMVLPVSKSTQEWESFGISTLFYDVPYEFLERDSWHDIQKQGEAAQADGRGGHQHL